MMFIAELRKIKVAGESAAEPVPDTVKLAAGATKGKGAGRVGPTILRFRAVPCPWSDASRNEVSITVGQSG